MDWFFLANEHELDSPSLIIHAERVEENLRQMLAIAGDASRLRPHVKTHKLPQLVARQMEFGIQKFKCATIAEAEMVASAGALDVLLAAQLVGPNIARFVQLLRQFPETRFSSLIDAPEPLDSLAKALQAAGETATLLLDLDVGQHRTGIAPGPAAFALYQRLAT
ncbi:MAG: alanine racemase, partial [Chthoniobacteraceae bacterium]|nr:alanine racemase [Chthoniobacteraceae bacterium]